MLSPPDDFIQTMTLKTLPLTDDDRQQLRKIVKYGDDWRERHRAQTILLFAEGKQAKDIAVAQEIGLDTVYERRLYWLASGFEAIRNKKQGGAPIKLTDEHRGQLRRWASDEALTAPQLLAKLQDTCQVVVHENTLRRALKQMGFVWKRTRHSLKKNATPSSSIKHVKTSAS